MVKPVKILWPYILDYPTILRDNNAWQPVRSRRLIIVVDEGVSIGPVIGSKKVQGVEQFFNTVLQWRARYDKSLFSRDRRIGSPLPHATMNQDCASGFRFFKGVCFI